MTDETKIETTNVVAAAAEKVEDAALTITELIEHVPMMYIVVALLVGVVIGAGVLLLMDDAAQKKVSENDGELEILHQTQE